jgi:hypothetical protein
MDTYVLFAQKAWNELTVFCVYVPICMFNLQNFWSDFTEVWYYSDINSKLCIAELSVMTLFFVIFEVVIAVAMKCPVFGYDIM